MAGAAPVKMPPSIVSGTLSPRGKKRRVLVVKGPKALRAPALQEKELFPPPSKQSLPLPEGKDGDAAGAACPMLGRRRRQGLHRPRHVRTIFEPQQQVQPPQLRQPHRFRPAEGVRTWCDLCCHYIFSASQRCADCKYTCHSRCQDLVHLDCQQNGKLMECRSTYDINDGQL
ncbi:ras association domain-containing protein 5-like [Rhineura floridana]|uniref:ras association domain-containing protein 5-like n=1 Tax=Rhineura floridana TaxID=261503 RepID=UPI002AC7F8B8|nr:ras association domain-containing protein 5-like [Rhineura floridana]